jgi:hypothetical protein
MVQRTQWNVNHRKAGAGKEGEVVDGIEGNVGRGDRGVAFSVLITAVYDFAGSMIISGSAVTLLGRLDAERRSPRFSGQWIRQFDGYGRRGVRTILPPEFTCIESGVAVVAGTSRRSAITTRATPPLLPL